MTAMTVIVEFSEQLEAELGAPCTYVHVDDGETVRGLVERVAREFGASVRDGLLSDERLQSDVAVVRQSAVTSEPLSPESSVSAGDRVRFRL